MHKITVFAIILIIVIPDVHSMKVKDWTKSLFGIGNSSSKNIITPSTKTLVPVQSSSTSLITDLDEVKRNTNIYQIVYHVNGYQITLVDLKSLEPKIKRRELEAIREQDPHFLVGYVTNVIIDSYASVLLNTQPDIGYLTSDAIQLIYREIKLDKSDSAIFKQNTVYAPFYEPQLNHWVLIQFQDCTTNALKVTIYDSLRQAAVPESLQMFIALIGILLNKDVASVNYSFSAQQNDANCGVFVCWYLDRLLDKLPTTVTSLNTDEYRIQIYNTLKLSSDEWVDKLKKV